MLCTCVQNANALYLAPEQYCNRDNCVREKRDISGRIFACLKLHRPLYRDDSSLVIEDTEMAIINGIRQKVQWAS